MHLNSILIRVFIYFLWRLIVRGPVSETKRKNQADRHETWQKSLSANQKEWPAPSPAPEGPFRDAEFKPGAFSRRPGLPHGDAGDRQDLPGEKQSEPGVGVVLPPEGLLDLPVHIKDQESEIRMIEREGHIRAGCSGLPVGVRHIKR